MTIGEKVKAVRKAKRMSQEAFGEVLHVSGGYVSSIEAGKKMPADGLLEMLLLKFDISEEWWETEEGDIFRQDAKKPQEDDTLRLVLDAVRRSYGKRHCQSARLELASIVLKTLEELGQD